MPNVMSEHIKKPYANKNLLGSKYSNIRTKYDVIFVKLENKKSTSAKFLNDSLGLCVRNFLTKYI